MMMKLTDRKKMREKVLATPGKHYETKTYQYWIDNNGSLCRARLTHFDTMAMYNDWAIEVLD